MEPGSHKAQAIPADQQTVDDTLLGSDTKPCHPRWEISRQAKPSSFDRMPLELW